jgi:hypothetical protein
MDRDGEMMMRLKWFLALLLLAPFAWSQKTGTAFTWYCPDSSTSSTAYVCVTTPSFTPAAGDSVLLTGVNQNSGASPTLSVNGVAHPISVNQGNGGVSLGALQAGASVLMTNTGSAWQMQGQSGAGATLATAASQCELSVAAGSTATTFGSCAGSSSTNWSALVANSPMVSGPFQVSTGGSIVPINSGVIQATAAPWSGLTGTAPSTTVNGTACQIGGSCSPNTPVGQVTGTFTSGSNGFGTGAFSSTYTLPAASAGALGGVNSITSSLHNWVSYIDTSGLPHQSRPACADLSDSSSGCSTAAYSLPAATSSTLGGVKPDGTSILNTAGAISATAASVGAEPALGNPETTGYVLSSTTAGVRSWVANGSGGAVFSVSNSDSTLTVTPTTGAVVASLNLGHANTWTAAQTFPGATFSGSGAGYFALTQGADNCVANQPTGSVCWEAPASGVTSYHGLFAVTPSSGIPHYAYSSPTITETISAITPSDATGNTTGTGNFVLATSPTFVTGLSSPAITDSGISQYGVLFAGSGGLLSGIPADFYYNDTGYDSLPTLQLGVRGSQAIDAHFEVYGSNDTSAHFHNVGTTGTGLSADGGIISLSAVPTGAALGSGVIMGTLQFGGSDSTSDTEATGAIISAWTTQAWTSSAFGSQLKFYTTPNSSTTLTQALLLDQNQAATFAGAVTISGQLLATEPTGSVWGSATGGAKGAGTINAAGLYVNGAAVGTSSGTVTSSGYSSGTPLAAFSTSTNITPATSSNVIALFGSGSCSGYLKSDGTCSTPGGSGTVTVVSSGSLTSTALVTGGGTTTLQTPSTTSTLDASGNLAVAAGGSLGSADSGSPKFTFASNKATFNQPLYLGTASNQLVTGTGSNLTTLTFPASSGAVTLTFPITSEYMVGANSDTTTTHVLHATSVAGVFNSTAIAAGDLPGGAGELLAGATPALTYTPTLGVSGTAGSLSMFPATGNFTTTWASGATASNTIQGFAAVPTTGHLIDCTVTSTTCLLHDSGVVTANVVNASSPGAGIAHFAGSTQTVTSSAVVNGDITSMAESKLTGSATATTITEVAAGDVVTRAGVETGNLTAPYVIENTNSTNNNTSIGALIGAAGTSTGGIGELVFDVSGTGDIVRWYSGGSVSAGVYTVGTLEGHLSAAGALTLASTVSATGGNFSGLTASLPVCTDGSKNLSSTCTNLITGAMMANATVTATQLAAQYSKGSCTEVWGGTGTSNVLTAGDDAISNNTCYNDSGVTRTITAVKCRSDYSSNTTTVNPSFGSAGTGTTVCSGTLQCGNSYAYSSSCSVSNASWTTGTGIDPVMGTPDTHSTSLAVIIEYTY